MNIMGIGDWGLGIGPIPNPQTPIPNTHIYYFKEIIKKIKLINKSLVLIEIQ